MTVTEPKPDGRLLEVSGAEVRFALGRSAVAGAWLTLGCGQITALLGASGAGKSTLLRAIAGLELLHRGEIRFDGQVWSAPDQHTPPEKRRCGVVFQDYALFPHLNALDNVAFGLREGSRTDRRRAALSRLESVELTHRTQAYPHELSGGEQQRVALARALAIKPDVMLLDEPFSGLDRRLRRDLRGDTADVLRQSGVTTLIVTHDAEEALEIADTIALMQDGRIIQTGAPDTLYLKPSSLTAARLLGDVETFTTRVRDGQAKTALGALPATGFVSDQKVRLMVRPEGVIVDRTDTSGARARISHRQTSTGYARLTCTLENDRRIEARVALSESHKPGDAVRLRFDPAFTHLVCADAD